MGQNHQQIEVTQDQLPCNGFKLSNSFKVIPSSLPVNENKIFFHHSFV